MKKRREKPVAKGAWAGLIHSLPFLALLWLVLIELMRAAYVWSQK